MLDIIKDFNPKSNINTINKIKQLLIEEYQKNKDNSFKLGNILSFQGKETIAKKFLLGEIDIEIMILSENYYLTNLDIIFLSKILNLPIILISSVTVPENKKPILILNKNQDYLYVIKIPKVKVDLLPQYNLLYYNQSIKLDKKNLSLSLQNDIRINDIFNELNYINEFKTTIKKPTKLKILPATTTTEISKDEEDELMKILEQEEQEEQEDNNPQSEKPMIKLNKSL